MFNWKKMFNLVHIVYKPMTTETKFQIIPLIKMMKH